MDKLLIEGGRPLRGKVKIDGAKNAALPILAACILVEGKHEIHNVPDLLDIRVMLEILEELGCKTDHTGHTVTLDTTDVSEDHIPEHLMRKMRSSVFLMGPLLGRFGSVQFYQPGGCAIGERKIDLHLRGLESLGAKIDSSNQTIKCSADQLLGADIMLDFPSVGATENLMMAAVKAKGETKITNAAKEPEIMDLANFLNAMGAQVSGAGTDTITIQGVDQMEPAPPYDVIPDRIVAGTLMIAAAATQGNILLEHVEKEHLASVIHVLRRIGVDIEAGAGQIQVSMSRRPKSLERLITSPYPAFPTDLQAQLMTLLSLSDGYSLIKETIFEGRFKHVDELVRMGADIRVDLNTAFIRGVSRLYGAQVEATDLRAGAALVIAGLAAEGETRVGNIHHIDRGYERIERIFGQLGGHIERLHQGVVIS